METGLNRFEQIRLVVLDREDEVPAGLEDHLGQRPLREQGIGREDLEEGVVFQQLGQRGLEGLRFGGFAVGDGKLGQAEAQIVGEDVEHVDRIAVGVMALLAGLTVDGRDHVGDDLAHVDQPKGNGFAELLEREPGDHAAEGCGMRRFLPRKAQRPLEGSPVVLGPTLDAREIGLPTEQAEKGQGQDRVETVSDATRLARVVDPAKSLEKRRHGSGHP